MVWTHAMKALSLTATVMQCTISPVQAPMQFHMSDSFPEQSSASTAHYFYLNLHLFSCYEIKHDYKMFNFLQ